MLSRTFFFRSALSSMSSSLSAPPGRQEPIIPDHMLLFDGGGNFLPVTDEKLAVLPDRAGGSHDVKKLRMDDDSDDNDNDDDGGGGAGPALLPLLPLLPLRALPPVPPPLRLRLPSMMNMTAMTTSAATLPTTGAAIHACEPLSPSAAAESRSEGDVISLGVALLSGGRGISVVMGMVRICVTATFEEMETEVIMEIMVSVVTGPLTLAGGVKNDALSGTAIGTSVGA